MPAPSSRGWDCRPRDVHAGNWKYSERKPRRDVEKRRSLQHRASRGSSSRQLTVSVPTHRTASPDRLSVGSTRSGMLPRPFLFERELAAGNRNHFQGACGSDAPCDSRQGEAGRGTGRRGTVASPWAPRQFASSTDRNQHRRPPKTAFTTCTGSPGADAFFHQPPVHGSRDSPATCRERTRCRARSHISATIPPVSFDPPRSVLRSNV